MKLTKGLSNIALLGLISLTMVLGAQANFVYLRTDSVDIRNFPAAPVRGSSADETDLDEVLKLQSTRSPSECHRATDEANVSVESFFGMDHAVLSPQELALVKGLFYDIGDDANEFISPLKKIWARPRPYQRDSRVMPCVPRASGYSYPSGHATLGRVTARALGLIFRDRENALLERGDEIAFDRVMGGVHHPHDVQAGRLLGDQVFDALIKSSDFMHRIDEIRARAQSYDYTH